MSIRFFPQVRLFWIYHGSILLILGLIQSMIIFLWREEKLFNFLCGLLWLPLFTFAVLLYRYCYKTRQWNQFSTGSNIALVVGYSLVSGLIVALLMLGLVIPFFWLDVEKILLQHNISAATLLSQLVITNWFQTMLFVASWIFIYISIVTRQLVKETELTNLRLQNSLKEAQLANLSHQLNPHFLFNTLNNIKFMVRRDPQKTENMVTDLSDILRYSLESNRKEKVQICEELEVLNRYLDIVKVQMEDRLSLHLSIPQSLHANLIPPMILQLLIENAIKHGVDCLRYGGKVTLIAEAVSDQIHFLVENDIPQVNNNAKANMGIGLANIEQRLKLLYGNRASFVVDSLGSKFSVRLILPMEVSQ